MILAISHENEGVTLDPEERDRLLQECPSIASCMDWSPSGFH